jgi:glycine/D-amino acid oxidase-like deaminating enzyme
MQRVRAPAAETGPMPRNLIPGFLRGAAFGARQNRNGMIRITGGYRYSAMLHDLSLNDFRDLRVWAPALWQNRKDVAIRLAPLSLKAELSSGLATLRARGAQTFVPQGYQPAASPRLRRDQLRALARLIPALKDARIHRAFAGTMDLTPDLEPVIGRIPGSENGYVATGFSGHGYLYGPGACQAIARLMVDGEPGVDLTRYHPDRLRGKVSMRQQIF